MKKNSLALKLISVTAGLVMVVTSVFTPASVLAKSKPKTTKIKVTTTAQTTTTSPQLTQQGETTTASPEQVENAKKSLERQKKELEQSIKDSEKKLKELEKTSKVTQEYIDTLDAKIGSTNNQLTVLSEQITSLENDIKELKPQIDESTKQLDAINKKVARSQKELDALNTKFQATYNAYCYRLRVMYISGDYSIISALLSCKDVSGFYTRYEMIKTVAKSDTQLLKEVNSKMEEICTKQNGLDEQKAKQQSIKDELNKKKSTLESKQKKIEDNQTTLAKKKITLAQDRAECDSLLAQLTAQNQMYTEYLNEDSDKAAAVENEISSLISGLKTPQEVTTAVQGNSNVTAPVQGGQAGGLYSNNDAVLNLKYPAPGHYTVSAGFPNYSSGRYHGGIDFPCGSGSKIVAAQSGVVMTVKRLDYSYGYYVMIYHGTDSKGRTVVTLYAHNSSILVSAGQTVTRGQQIAKSGSTGNSTGPHCHFEVRLDGARVNPTYYLSK